MFDECDEAEERKPTVVIWHRYEHTGGVYFVLEVIPEVTIEICDDVLSPCP